MFILFFFNFIPGVICEGNQCSNYRKFKETFRKFKEIFRKSNEILRNPKNSLKKTQL